MFTRTFPYTAGQTDLYAYPASASYALSSTPWTTHRVLATELVAGMYSVTVDELKSHDWSVFDGATVPTTHDDAIVVLRYANELVAIQAKTDLIPAAPAAVSDIPSAAAIATAVWGAGTRTLTSFGTLVADVATAVWAAGTRTLTAISDSSGITTLLTRIVGTLAAGTHQPQSGDSFARLGAPVGASISADVQTRLATSGYTAPANSDIAAIKTKTDQLAFTVANQVDANALSGGGGGGGLDAAGVRAALGLASANLDTQLADLPTVSELNARTLPSDDYFVVSDYTAPDATKLIDVWRRLGLDPANPLVNTATLISAGSTLQIDVTQTSTTVTTTRQP